VSHEFEWFEVKRIRPLQLVSEPRFRSDNVFICPWSRDVMVTLEARLVKMELTIADKLEAYDERIEKLESAGDKLQEKMQSALNSAVDMLQ